MSEFRYMPALDGLRAMAVVAVLFFHAQSSFAPGGFLGVSVFFTLSGYLITSLLLSEHANTRSISLRAFYARRLRRLAPGSYACIAVVIALGATWTAYQREHLAGDVVAALANVSNWRFAFASRSYSELFLASPSPLAHYWSLAIEEQCYLVLPVVVLLALRRGQRTLFVVTAVLLSASLIATLLTTNFDLIYNGTHTRAAELLIGVLLAQVLFNRRIAARSLTWFGAAALVSLAALVANSDVRDRWLYRGGLPAVAVLSATVIAALVSGGVLARALAWRPLVAIGKISYGLYLVHWPLFVVLSPARTHLHGVMLTAVRLAISLALATLSYHQLELPIRQRHVLATPRVALSALSVALPTLLIASLVALPLAHYTPTEQLLAKGASGLMDFNEQSSLGSAQFAKKVTYPAPSRILVVGSDNSPVTLLALLGYDVIDGVQPGCPIANAVEARLSNGSILSTSACEPMQDRWPRLVTTSHPDLVIVSTGSLDRSLIKRASDTGYPTSAQLVDFAARAEAAYADIEHDVALIESAGVPIAVVDHPAPMAAGDALENVHMARLRLSHPEIGGFVTTDPNLITTVHTLLSAPGRNDPRLRVLVIGDSTSFNLAEALSDAAPDRLHVMWAGENGCAFVRAEQTRARTADPWTPNTCAPFDVKLPPLLDSLHPQVVLLVASLFELTEQRYPGDPAAHAAGDPQYVAFHDSEMADFLSILRAHAVPLLIADSPAITAGWATAEQANPLRTAAWNAQIRRWVASSPFIGLFDYNSPLQAVEATHGSIRPDGVHPEITALTDLARVVYVPELITQTAVLRAALGLAP